MSGGSEQQRPSYDELAGLVATQARVIEQQAAKIAQLEAEVAALKAENAELKRRLGLNSTNSSKPPSTDGPFTKPAPRSQRRPSGRKPGGQPGHPGANLERVADPDAVIDHRPTTCDGCGHALPADALVEGFSACQVFDLPEPKLLVTEHRMLKVRCPCGHLTCARAPQGAGAPTQYGPGVHALAVYGAVAQHLPGARGVAAAAELHAAPMSEGFVHTALGRAAEALAGFQGRIKTLIAGEPVAHFDESGARIGAELHWVHVACTEALTYYQAHAKRGRAAMEAIGILPAFTGVVVSDALSSYTVYGTVRSLCNAHLIRELDGVYHADPVDQAWAKAALDVLTEANAACHSARAQGLARLPAEQIERLAAGFDQALKCGRSANPDPPGGGRKPYRRTLVDRMRRRREDFLRFVHDLAVPFTNNQAEQDIRMVKVQQKVSGGWRTLEGANRWLLVRSYICTARKHGINPLTALRDLCAGNPWMPPVHA
jgi:transposase